MSFRHLLLTSAGRLVTGTFKHTSGEVYDLKLESESEPIGVTARHPYWSVDREAWVSAIDLEIGETLKTLAGTTVVEGTSKREEPETVYNIEVEGDHVYRVGESGVLVHNVSNPCCGGTPVKNPGAGKRLYSNKDSQGRPTKIYAKITPELMKHGTDVAKSIRPPGFPAPGTSDHPWARGHLHGNQLGGLGTGEEGEKNLVTILQKINNEPYMLKCENRVADAVQCGQVVEYWVEADYGGSTTRMRPKAIKIKARGKWADGPGIKLDVTIQNRTNAAKPTKCEKE